MFSHTRLVERIRQEYVAMPGLKLTRDQVCRLWGVGQDVCDVALQTLLTEGFLHQTGTGKYVALPRPAGAALAVGQGGDAAASLRCPHCGKRNTINVTGMSIGHERDITIRCEACQRVVSFSKQTA
jgi:hypothetical protein